MEATYRNISFKIFNTIMAKSNILLLVLVTISFCSSSAIASEEWQLGNFTKQDEVNPIMGPEPNTTFHCPVRDEIVYWERKDVFNPTAVVRDGKVHMLYRAEDDVGAYMGTSRIGLAVSSDGLHFVREKEPIFYPDNDSANVYEWEGGVEDPRIAQDENGTYILMYTGYNGTLARLMVATSTDLRNWTKHGLVFGQAKSGRYEELWSKAGAVVTTLDPQTDRFIATKINGKYWMYWGESDIYVATSDNLLDWEPVTNSSDPEDALLPIFSPRPGKFDSDLVEPGPQAMVRDDGILLIYNSKNLDPKNGGDPNLPLGTYSAGQVILNITDPTHLLARMENYFMTPDRDYEIIGQVNNVVFLEGLVHFQNKWFLYYGTADSKIAVATIG